MDYSNNMFAKIFKSLFNGTMRGTRDLITVWVNILANSDAHGYVDITPRVIADETGVPIEIVESCITQLESPDPMSRTPDLAGSRLERIDEHRTWGWKIVNFEKYRNTCTTEQRKEQLRVAQERFRTKKLGIEEPSVLETPNDSIAIPENLNTKEFLTVWGLWKNHRSEIKKKMTPTAIQQQLKAMSKLGPKDAVTAIEHSIANGFQGIYRPRESVVHSTNGSSGADKVIMGEELKRINEKIKKTLDSYDSHQNMTEKDRDIMSKMKARKTQIMNTLGVRY